MALPSLRKNVRRASRDTALPSNDQRLLVLVVDADHDVRDVLAMLFNNLGYKVREAAHGSQALDLVAREHPDLVASDVMLPVLDGAEMCRRLKHNAATSHIPVILMSAVHRPIAHEVGADAVLEKPFDLDVLVALVRR